jgi:hypothetical protein
MKKFSAWKTFNEINRLNKTREFVFWGATIWLDMTLKNYNFKFSSILDNNKNNQETLYMGRKILSPKILKKLKQKPFIVICTASYKSVIKELKLYNYKEGLDYCITPLLITRKKIDSFLNLDEIIIFSSPEHSSTKNQGGGLYQLTTKTKKIKKIFSGKLRGLVKIPNGFAVIDMLKGILILNKKFKIIKIIKLKEKSEAHGLFYDKFTNCFFVGQSGRDSVGIYKLSSGQFLKELFVSGKWKKNGLDNHHINDVYVDQKHIFISMFSFSGNWSKNVFDGGVLKVNKNNYKNKIQLYKNLWMPHSIRTENKKLLYVDSMRGNLMKNNDIICNFSGFVRGLDHNNENYFSAISSHRYPEKLFNESNNISLDCGVFCINKEYSLTKFFEVNQTNSIHSVLIV